MNVDSKVNYYLNETPYVEIVTNCLFKNQFALY